MTSLTTSAAAQPTLGAAATPPSSPVISAGALGAAGVAATGALSTSVSLAVPSYHGLAPDLSLRYSSHTGDGWVGVGWTLAGVSEITRLSAGRGVPTYGDDDIFQLGGQDLVPCGDSTGRAGAFAPSCRYPAPKAGSPGCGSGSQYTYAYYTTRDEQDLVICRARSARFPVTDYWTVTAKDGTVSTYRGGPWSFLLSSVRDLRGNEVFYSWGWAGMPADETPELREIDYSGARVRFYDEPRPDPVTVAVGGQLTRLTQRLKTIDVTVGSARARAYRLAYQTSPATGRSVLRQVETFGTNASVDATGDVTGTPLPGQTFDTESVVSDTPWQQRESSASLPAAAVGTAGQATFDAGIPPGFSGSSRLGDFAGDGRSDLALVTGQSGCRVTLMTRIPASADGTPHAITLPSVAGQDWCQASDWWTADIDGDGRADLIVLARNGDRSLIAGYKSVGNGDFRLGPVSQPVRMRDYRCAPGDFDGSGRVGLACLYRNAPAPALPRLVSFLPTEHAAGWSTTDIDPHLDQGVPATRTLPPAKFSDLTLHVGDVDGDGRDDIVHPVCGIAVDDAGFDLGCDASIRGLQTLRSEGQGRFSIPANALAQGPQLQQWRYAHTAAQMADLNGDGLADYVSVTYLVVGDTGGLQYAEQAHIAVALSTGRGTWQFKVSDVPDQFAFSHYSNLGGVVPITPVFTRIGSDARAGLMMVLPRAAHNRPSACAPAIATDHLEVFRVPSRGDGTFDWPASWDDCSHDQELKIDVSAYNAWELLVDFFNPLTSFPLVELRGYPVRHDRMLGDVDGNGAADWVIVHKRLSTDRPSVVIAYTPRTRASEQRWETAATSSDGRAGLLTIDPTYPSPVVTFARPRTTPPPAPCLKQPSDPGCGDYLLASEQLKMPFVPPPLDSPVISRNWKRLDTTGSGKDSLVYIDSSTGTSQTTIYTYTPTSTGWNPDPVSSPVQSTTPTSDWLPADLAGDGRMGFVGVVLSGPSTGVLTLTPDGSGHFAFHLTPVSTDARDLTDGRWQVTDLNRDHRSDLIHIAPTASGASVESIINRGNGNWTLVRKDVGMAADANQADWLLADTNGDGVPDIVHIDAEDAPDHLYITTALSQGDGTWADPKPPIDVTTGANEPSLTYGRWAAADVTGTGSHDLVHIAPIATSDHTTNAVRVITLRSLGDSSFALDGQTLTTPGTSPVGWQYGDTTGDGVQDLLAIDPAPDGTRVESATRGIEDDRITTIHNGIGGSASATYAPSAPYRTSCSMPAGWNTTVLTRLQVSAGAADSSTTQSFSYSCPAWSSAEHRLLGWTYTQTVTPASASTDGLIETTTHRLSEQCGDQRVAVLDIDPKGPALKAASFTYNDVPADPSYDCRLAASGSRDCATYQACASRSLTYGYDAYGNVNRTSDSMTAADGSLLDRRTTLVGYQGSTAPYVVDLPRQRTLLDSHDKPLTHTAFCYDDHCDGPAPRVRGLLTDITQVALGGADKDRQTKLGYDNEGNLTSKTDPAGNPTQTIFDQTYHLYPETVTNALGQTTTTKWDYALGLPISTTDANELTTRFGYDQYGRLEDTTAPGTAEQRTSYSDFGTPSQRIHTTTADGSSDGLWTDVTFDGLGRQVQLQRKGAQGGIEATASTYDDATNAVYRQSHWTTLNPQSADVPAETYHRDALGRIVRVEHPDGHAITTTYTPTHDGTVAATRDEASHEIDSTTDPWGRLAQVAQPGDGTVATLTYGYDEADHLTSLLDSANNRTTRNWDALGDLRQEVDPDRGTTTYTYDPAGNLHTLTDARGLTITYGYDPLNRMTREDVPGQATPLQWNYDQPGHGPAIGRLTSESGPSADGCPDNVAKSLNYDQDGRLSSTTSCIAGQSAALSTSYDPYGRAATITYPDGEDVPLHYDAAGRLQSLGSYATNAIYDPSGQLTSLQLGDGSVDNRAIDPNRGWETSTQITTGNSTVYARDSERNPDGTVQGFTSSVGDSNLGFTYDALGRLTHTTRDLTQDTTFDPTGNITTDSTNGTYHYGTPCHDGFAPAHAPSEIGFPGDPYATRFCYDADGNRTSMDRPFDRQTIQWDGQGNPAKIGDTQLTHDPDGALVRQTGTAPTVGAFDIRYYGPLAQRQAGTGLVKQYVFDGILVARHDQTGTTYYHTDNHGSPHLITDEHGNPLARISYEPWGATSTISGSLPLGSPGFNATQPIIGTDLVQMGARLYDTAHGQFASADIISPASTDAQATNRYAYARNNPISNTDPSGHDSESDLPNYTDVSAWWTSYDVIPWRVDGPVDTVEVDSRSTPYDGQTVGNPASSGNEGPSPVLEGAAGVAYGTIQALTPGGFMAPSPAPQSRRFEYFRAAGQTATGIAEIIFGATGETLGTMLDVTGIGALVGVPLNVASTALIADGAVNTIAGGVGLVHAMSMSGEGGSGSDSGGSEPRELTYDEKWEQAQKALQEQESAQPSSGEMADRYQTPEAAIGQVEGEARVIDVVRTENPGLRAQGFRETWYVEDANGTQWTVAHNPRTGEFTALHHSSKGN